MLINKSEVVAVVDAAKGTFMQVTFIKKDGSIRTMNCRTGVKKYLKGSGTDRTTSVLSVYENGKGYRSFDPSRVVEMRACGHHFINKDGVANLMNQLWLGA